MYKAIKIKQLLKNKAKASLSHLLNGLCIQDFCIRHNIFDIHLN